MLDAKRMEIFKENGADAALKLRGELVTALQERITGTMRGVNTYFDSRRKSETAISGRIKELESQREGLEEKVASFGPKLAAATISGDSDTLEKIQEQLTALEARKAATIAQIELLSGVSVAGDKELFTEADRQARELDQFWTEIIGDLSSLSTFASEQMNAWYQVAGVSGLGGNILPRNAVFSRVDEMRKDFHEKEGANNE